MTTVKIRVRHPIKFYSFKNYLITEEAYNAILPAHLHLKMFAPGETEVTKSRP